MPGAVNKLIGLESTGRGAMKELGSILAPRADINDEADDLASENRYKHDMLLVDGLCECD